MSKRILVLVHTDLVPPDNPVEIDRYTTPWVVEYDVITQLRKSGHEVQAVGLYNTLDPLLEAINSFKPDVVFNLLEEFNGDSKMDYHIVALLESLNIKYTGCCSKGLILAKDKALSKKILKYHSLGTAGFVTIPRQKRLSFSKKLKYPLIVKCLYEEASLGIAQASIVNSEEKLSERVEYIHLKLDQDAIAEEFIEGRELYVGIIGNVQLKALPIWELQFTKVDDSGKEIYSRSAKWNKEYRKRRGIKTGPAQLDKAVANQIIKSCKKLYRVLNLSGYARIDLRLTDDNRIYILEANPNPNLAFDDEFAQSAKYDGINYADLLEMILLK